MLQAMVSRVMEKYHDKHDFSLGHGGVTVIFAFCCRFKRIFRLMASKNLQNSSAIQNNSITLFSVIIATIACKTL